ASLAEARPLYGCLSELGGRPEAVAVGLADRVGARTAAYGNAWLADLLDYEDTFKSGGNHPSATVIPAAVAVAERVGARGIDLLAAIIAGYDVVNRSAHALYPEAQQPGFLSTGTAGALGAAAAASRVLGLHAPTIAQAIKIAGFLLPISAADTLWEGHSAKPAHSAQAAALGIEAALLAARGFTGAPLEGGDRLRGGYLHMLASAPDRAPITEGLGETFTIAQC